MKKIKSLEGIRALACLGVVLGHFRGAFLPGFDSYRGTPLELVVGGANSVRTLFLLSGFVLCIKYFQSSDFERIPIDICKRWFRLMPVILVCDIIVYILMKLNLFYNAEAAELIGTADFLGAFNRFIPLLKDCIYDGLIGSYFGRKVAFIGPLWTMKYEYIGSLLVLTILGVFKNNKARYIVYILFLSLYGSNENYYSYFLIGMIICDICFETEIVTLLKKHQIIATVGLLGSFGLFSVTRADWWKFGAICMFMIVMLLSSDIGGRVFGCKLLVWIGKHSFTIYAVHWIVYETFSSWFYLKMIGNSWNVNIIILVDLVISLIIVLCISILMTKYIENIASPIVLWIEKNYNRFNRIRDVA